jgi:hypothetical protein
MALTVEHAAFGTAMYEMLNELTAITIFCLPGSFFVIPPHFSIVFNPEFHTESP